MPEKGKSKTLQHTSDWRIKLVRELMSIPGPTCREGKVAQWIIDTLETAGLSRKNFYRDEAHRKSPFDGECGNLIIDIPGTLNLPRRMLSAHMDTVSVHVGSQPQVEGDRIISTSQAGVGTDNRAGVAIVLQAALTILSEGYPHPPLTLLFTVQEEANGQGARFAELEHFGRPAMCFDWDGQPPERVTVSNKSKTLFEIVITGTKGKMVSDAFNIPLLQARAINALYEDGWVGRVEKRGQEGLSSIGIIEAPYGDFYFETNLSIDRMVFRGEAREYDSPGFDREIAEAYREAFERAAEEIAEEEIAGCDVDFQVVSKGPEPCRLEKSSPVVREAVHALEHFGAEPWYNQAGNDAGRFRERGLAAIQLGTGGFHAHSPDNYLEIPSYKLACDLALWLATAGSLE